MQTRLNDTADWCNEAGTERKFSQMSYCLCLQTLKVNNGQDSCQYFLARAEKTFPPSKVQSSQTNTCKSPDLLLFLCIENTSTLDFRQK